VNLTSEEAPRVASTILLRQIWARAVGNIFQVERRTAAFLLLVPFRKGVLQTIEHCGDLEALLLMELYGLPIDCFFIRITSRELGF